MNINPIFAADAVCAALVYWDARRHLPPVRGYPRQRMTALFWGLGVLLFWFAVLPLYVLRRSARL